jgi:hypothetical protein
MSELTLVGTRITLASSGRLRRERMSERKLYEIALRAVGLILIPGAIGYLGITIQSTLVAAGNLYVVGRAVTTGVYFLIYLAAVVVLIALAPRLARAFSAEEPSTADPVRFDLSTIMRAGISLIGVYSIASGIPELVVGIMRSVELAQPAVADSFSGSSVWVSPAVRVAIGLALALHWRLLPWLRKQGRAIQRFHEETRDVDR